MEDPLSPMASHDGVVPAAGGNLTRLRELTKKLTRSATMQNWVEYEMTEGIAFGFGLLKQADVAVQHLFMSAGCVFPPHAHDCHEWLIVYEGRLSLQMDGEEQELGKGDYSYCAPGCTHGGHTLETTRLICVSVPCDPVYPDA